MSKERKLICIVCPVGCEIKATIDKEKKEIISLTGNQCRRGAAYAKDEIFAPKRVLTTTVRVEGGFLPVVPVRTAEPIPKDKIRDALKELAALKVTAPVAFHQVICPNVAGTGVAVIAERPLPAEAGEKAG
jgi:CxxC motif-containing protein